MTPQKMAFLNKDKIIPWYFVLFFVFLLIVNIIFVTIATKTHPGVVQDNAYETGLHYNDIIKKYHTQKQLNWQTSLDFKNNQIILNLKDKDNQPITNATIQGLVTSVLNTPQEILVTLSPIGDGRYVAYTQFPHKGQWDIALAVLRGDKMMQIKKRVIAQ